MLEVIKVSPFVRDLVSSYEQIFEGKKTSYKTIRPVGGVHTQSRNFPIHQYMLDTFLEAVVRGEVTRSNLKAVTTKSIYKSRMKDLLMPPKVEMKYPLTNFQD